MVSMRKMKNSFRTNANNNGITANFGFWKLFPTTKMQQNLEKNQGKGEKSGASKNARRIIQMLKDRRYQVCIFLP